MNADSDSAKRPRRSQTTSVESRADPELTGKRRLPVEYVPDSTTIICGRGKACTASPGNIRLKKIVTEHIEQYSLAEKKAEKTKTVDSIIDAVQGQGKDQGMFVRRQNGTWWEVEDSFAREKVGSMIRDILYTQYRSSSRAKFQKKKRQKSQTAISKAKATNEAASKRPQRDVGGGDTYSPMIPSRISSGLFTLSGNSNHETKRNSISLRERSPQVFPMTQYGIVRQSIDTHDERAPGRETIAAESLQHLSRRDLQPIGSEIDIELKARKKKISPSGVAERNDSAPPGQCSGFGQFQESLPLALTIVDSSGCVAAHAEGLPDDLSGIFDD